MFQCAIISWYLQTKRVKEIHGNFFVVILVLAMTAFEIKINSQH